MPGCSVKSCKNSDRKHEKNVTFHRFPNLTKKDWLIALGRDPNSDISHTAVICSIHFKASDFLNYGARKRLNTGAIPSLHLFATSSSNSKVHLCESTSTQNILKETRQKKFAFETIFIEERKDTSFSVNTSPGGNEEMNISQSGSDSDSSTNKNKIVYPSKSDASSSISSSMKEIHNYCRSPTLDEKKNKLYYKAKYKNSRDINRRLRLKVASLQAIIKDLKGKKVCDCT